MNIASLIEVFRMEEISKKARAQIIIRIGAAINYQFSLNITEPLVYELVMLLDPENKILQDEHYKRMAVKEG